MATTKSKTLTPGPLDHLIPDPIFHEEYISRKINGIWDTDVLRYAKEARSNVLIFGPTGPGKTSLVLAYAAKEKRPVVTIQCNGAVDPNAFWTHPEFADGLLKDMADSEVTQVIRYGGVLYMDEINFLPPKVAAVWHGLLDKRRQITIPEKGNEVIKAHDDLLIVASYNPDYEGTKPLNAAFKNRFRLKVRFDYDPDVEKELVCIPAMLTIAGKLRLAHKAGDIETPVSTNMLIEFEELAVDLGYDFALQNFMNAFSDEERQAVTEAFDLYSDEIRSQAKKMEELALAGTD